MKFETELEQPVVNMFNRGRYRNYIKFAKEVQLHDRRIDLVMFNSMVERIYAIELKLNNWRKALQQALIYQLASDYTYIAMPSKKIENVVDFEKFKKYNIGLIAVRENEGAAMALFPERNKNTREEYKYEIIERYFNEL